MMTLVAIALLLGAINQLATTHRVKRLTTRVQFLEDENRWLRAELEIVVPGMRPMRDAGDHQRELCASDDHTMVIGDPNCIYCGEQVMGADGIAIRSGTMLATYPPADFPHARVNRGKR